MHHYASIHSIAPVGEGYTVGMHSANPHSDVSINSRFSEVMQSGWDQGGSNPAAKHRTCARSDTRESGELRNSCASSILREARQRGIESRRGIATSRESTMGRAARKAGRQ